jgi:ATP-dependent exoDNAse (exonuclease V) beta subunit
MTRARDHLVVSVHRPAKAPSDDRTKWTHAELVWHAAADEPGWEPFHSSATDRIAPETTNATTGDTPSPPPWEEWRAMRDVALVDATRRRVVSATALARSVEVEDRAADPGLAKGPRDLELPPWNKGRYGTALGRAVHAVLQTVDLATGAGLDDAAAAQAAAEGIVGREDDVAARAHVALGTRVVEEAVTHGFRREMYVATPVEGTTLEGYVDLVYRRPDGLVVVDYKTDAWTDDAELDAKVARYRLQGAAYAIALEQATGEPVAECVFVFLGGTAAQERSVSDLPEAMREVRAALGASSAGATTPAHPRSGR